MPARLEFDLNLSRSGSQRAAPARPGTAMRLLLLGNFSGRAAAERPPLASRPTQRVDLDSLDTVLRRLAPRVRLAAGDISFEQLDDFHPERLFARLHLFEALRQARAHPPASHDDLLGRLLGKPAAAPAASATPATPATPASSLDALIHSIVAPHIVQDTAAQAKPYLAAVDSAIAEQMRKLLHDPAFQSLESAWRGVQWLISSLELDETLQLHLFDVTREELLADVVTAQGQLTQTGLHHALAERWRGVPGGEGWSMIAGLMHFGPADADIGLLAALGLIAAQAGGPFIAAGDAALAGDDSAALAGWQALRRSQAAPWIGLATPRVLLRLPYGKGSDPVDGFTFEEFGPTPVHEEFLWGNPALAVALLIGRAFMARGWAMAPGDEREIGDLPAYTFAHNGETELQACAESYLGEQAGLALLDAGLMPLLSHRQRNAVSLMRMQSVALPARPLAGLAAG